MEICFHSISKEKGSSFKLHKKVISQMENELEQIDQLFLYYADLLAKVREATPDRVEMAALASVLHSFYNALENIFLSIAKGLDGMVPSGE